VRLSSVQHGQAGEDLADVRCRAGGVPGQFEPGLWVSPSVECDEALAKQGEPFRRLIASFLGSMDCLFKVGDSGVVVPSL
jgi:hypothetical protein